MSYLVPDSGTVPSDAILFFFFQAEDGIRDYKVTGVQTCALPISTPPPCGTSPPRAACPWPGCTTTSAARKTSSRSFRNGASRRCWTARARRLRSEEHTSELQSPCNLVCRLLLEKKKNCKILRYSH